MKTFTSILFIVVLIFFCSSCKRTLYVPNMQNVPLLKEKNEIRASFTPSNVQAAYGITNGLGLMLNAHFPNSLTLQELEGDLSTKRRFYEGGIGYFTKVNELGVFEIYGGVGKGKVSFDNRGNNIKDKFSSKFSRYFIQPSIGWTLENVDLAISLRYTRLSFYDLDTSEYIFDASKGFDQDLSLIDQNSYSFVEPAITLRLGMKYAKSFFQLQRVAQLNSEIIEYRDMQYTFGIHINIAKRFEEKPIINGLD